MCARSITRAARSSIPQSQATATLPGAPSARATSFQPVPLQSVQFSNAIVTPQCRRPASVHPEVRRARRLPDAQGGLIEPCGLSLLAHSIRARAPPGKLPGRTGTQRLETPARPEYAEGKNAGATSPKFARGPKLPGSSAPPAASLAQSRAATAFPSSATPLATTLAAPPPQTLSSGVPSPPSSRAYLK